jgi:Proto-chlorophyllide reductase 57 kD subunit
LSPPGAAEFPRGIPAATPTLTRPDHRPMNWSSDAETSLKEIPFVVRPIIRRKIESLAREAGLEGVDLAFYQQARERFGRK